MMNQFKATGEYLQYSQLKEEVDPYEKAINDWQYGATTSLTKIKLKTHHGCKYACGTAS